LKRLHDSLESNGVEIQIEVPDHSVVWCPCVGHFGSPDRWVSTRIVAGSRPAGTHHADSVSLSGRIPIDAAPNLRIAFDGVPIGGRS
jgi:hypothetical protein